MTTSISMGPFSIRNAPANWCWTFLLKTSRRPSRPSLRNYRKYAKIPGFRPGKVPESVIRRRYATEIRKDVIDSLLPERFNQGVRDLNVKPVGQPQVTELNIEDGQPLHVKAVFEFIPDFSIEGYQDVTVEKPSVEAHRGRVFARNRAVARVARHH